MYAGKGFCQRLEWGAWAALCVAQEVVSELINTRPHHCT